MKKIVLLLFISLCLSISGKRISEENRQQIKAAIEKQMELYPLSTLKDVYKNFFQDAFGPGHLMTNTDDATERMASYLHRECEIAKTDIDSSAAYIKTGWHGRFYRVNLSVINDNKVPFDLFLKALKESAKEFTLPSVSEWSKEWREIEGIFVSCGYKVLDYKADSKAIRALLKEGKYASHHSETYNKAYHPHYRLIEKKIFKKLLLPLIDK